MAEENEAIEREAKVLATKLEDMIETAFLSKSLPHALCIHATALGILQARLYRRVFEVSAMLTMSKDETLKFFQYIFDFHSLACAEQSKSYGLRIFTEQSFKCFDDGERN